MYHILMRNLQKIIKDHTRVSLTLVINPNIDKLLIDNLLWYKLYLCDKKQLSFENFIKEILLAYFASKSIVKSCLCFIECDS